MRVVSWNVGRLYSPTDNNRLDSADLPQIARTLYELDPDVVLMQEVVEQRQLDELLHRLPGYEGRVAERCRYDRHVAVLVRARLEPAFEQHLLGETGRGLAGATFSIGGARAFALSVHFDVFDRARRRSQAEEVAALAEGRAEALHVVGGDFNLDPGLAARLGNTTDAETFAILSQRFDDSGRDAGPTLFGLLRVDHLMIRGALLDRAHACVSPNRRLPMGDHDPLVCDADLAVDVRGRSS